MRLARLELTDVRSWGSLTLELPPGPVALVGPNATGKTSILESIYYVAALRSHRTSTDSVLVRAGQTSGIIRAAVEHEGRSDLVELEVVTQGRARARLGGGNVTRRRDLLGILRAALFAPERVAAVRGDPGDRRTFIDDLLIQLHPRYHAVMREYERALRQRNTLLREAEGRTPAGIEAWDESIAGPGGELCAGRLEAVAALAPAAQEAFRRVGGSSTLEIVYAPNVTEPGEPDAARWTEAIRRRLEERRADELVRKVTLVGPHRDDLTITIDGRPARTHASQGEAWLATLALTLGTHGAITDRVGDAILLFDDAFSLLDPDRRERLADSLPAGVQVIATTSDARECPTSMHWEMRRVSVEGVTPEV